MVRSNRFRHLYRNSTVWTSRKNTRSKFKFFSPPKSSKRYSWQVECGFHKQAESFLRKVCQLSLSVRQKIEGQILWKIIKLLLRWRWNNFWQFFRKCFTSRSKKLTKKSLKKLNKKNPEQSPWTFRGTLDEWNAIQTTQLRNV